MVSYLVLKGIQYYCLFFTFFSFGLSDVTFWCMHLGVSETFIGSTVGWSQAILFFMLSAMAKLCHWIAKISTT